jgi:stage V sporulation protein AE
MMYVKAFLVGGLICGLVQILMDRTKLLPGRIMVLLVCLGIVASVLGLYKPLVDFAGAGVTVPLCGFGHSLWEGVRTAINDEGFIGIFKGGFNASSIGISASLLVSYLASLIFNPKMKQ